ncbi:O-antigen ligase family protein [Leptolyngbya sp. BC1307]|uniref:O-antigen ligase family protein n=1 Tax=Leptolyngbya sp. BC1307 TaxID=2029589 RepID=UPI000EFB96D6|nr:O-antigen ligase family protein [Leptolyngbya sp. BC1307]
MKELLLSSPNIFILSSIGIAYFFLFQKYFSSAKKIEGPKRFFVYLIFLSMPNIMLIGFMLIQPSVLITPTFNVNKTIIRVLIYGSIIILLKPWFRTFPKSIKACFSDSIRGPFLALTVVSSLWSSSPLYSLACSFVFIAINALAAHIATTHSWKEIFQYLKWSLLTVAILSFLVSTLVPAIGIHEKGWKGVLEHPNRLGIIMALSATVWLINLLETPRQKILSGMAILLSIVTMHFTNSATSTVVLITMIGILFIVRIARTMGLRMAVICSTFSIIIAAIVAGVVSANLDAILGSLGKSRTLSGRGAIWPLLFQAIMKKPVLGYGYVGFWQDWKGEDDPSTFIRRAVHWGVGHAHNGFLELLLQLGIVGGVLFLVLLSRDFFRSLLHAIISKQPAWDLPIILVVFIVLSNFSVSEMITPKHVWFYYTIASVKLQSLPTRDTWAGSHPSASTFSA